MSTPLLQVKVALSGTLVAGRCLEAKTPIKRMIGLLNHDRLEDGEGLLLAPCNHVHTWFMRFPIDAVFISAENIVLGIDELVPWKLSRLHWKSRKVLELPLGTCRKVGVKTGDRLEFTCSN